MSGRPLAMQKIQEIKRLKGLGLSVRAIARALKIHRSTIMRHLEEDSRSETAGKRAEAPSPPLWTARLDWVEIHGELQRGVPVNVLWEERHEAGQVPVDYAGFWKQLRKRYPNCAQSMHRIFAPGERLEIDYCDGIDILDPLTGEFVKTHLFVGVLCHSRYAYAEFSWSQTSADFLASHKRMLESLGGSAHVLSPDNLKSAVTKTHRYDPVVNPAYTRLAEHYGFAVVPARVRRPKDKAIVERTIQIFQRWFYYRVRHKTFTSLIQLNDCLREYLEIFHSKIHRIFRRSRKEMFEAEKEHLLPLPTTPYHVSIHRKATLHPDCHLAFDKNFYSAPHQHRGKILDVWATDNVVEIYYEGERTAIHARSKTHGKFKTNKDHYPETHKAYYEATPKYLRNQAAKLGPDVSRLIHKMLSGSHPLQHLRRAQGIVRLASKYEKADLNPACEIAIEHSKFSCQFIERLLKNPLLMNRREAVLPRRGPNEHLRGAELLN